MANPIHFEPKKVDPRQELQRRLEAAPVRHAEAILVAFDVLQEAHDQGLLDMLHGIVGSKDAAFGKVAEYAKQPVSTQALRNLILLGKIFGGIDPERLHNLASAPEHAEPPSLWQLFKRLGRKDTRRGLAMALTLISAIGDQGDEASNRR
jgi:uncharacterized protein YjgD (DUF1641 family)